jgi:hypothetical protein
MENEAPFNRHDRRREARHGQDAPAREPAPANWPTSDPAEWPTRETRLSRADTSKELTKRGYRCAYNTLATLATRGGGPPFQKFGPFSIYTWGTSIDWAEGRLTEPRASTAENDAA